MNFTEELTLPAAVERVEKMYFDPEFAPRKYRMLGHAGVEVVALDESDETFGICCRYGMGHSEGGREFTRRFFKGDGFMSVRQAYSWDKPKRTGNIEITIEQIKSISICCSTRLQPQADVTILHQSWEVRCSLPLLGRALEKFVAEDIRKQSPTSLAATLRLLQDYQ